MTLILKIAFRYLISARGSTLLITFISFFGVFLSVCAILLTLGVFTGFQDSLKEKILSTAPHIIVSTVSDKDLKSIKKEIEKIPQVKGAIIFTLYSAILAKEGRVQPVTVKAVDYKEEFLKELVKKQLKEGLLRDAVVGKGIADVLGVRVGGEAVLVFPMGIRTPTGFIPKTKNVKIGGIFETGAYDRDFVLVYMEREKAKNFFKRGFRLEGVEVYVKDPYRVQEIKEIIREKIESDYIFIRSWIDLNKPLFNALQLEKLALFLILLLMVFVASFNITSLLFVKSREKVKDIAILKTFGMRSKDILAIFITVGISIGTVGSIVGIGASFLIAHFINEYKLIRVPEEVYMMSYIPVHIQFTDLLATFIGTILLSFGASLIPALKVAKENVIGILRNE